jgi:hypothetical protein
MSRIEEDIESIKESPERALRGRDFTFGIAVSSKQPAAALALETCGGSCSWKKSWQFIQ